jgi:metal-responsive CopG/Arc/MetJ family transcriptional regulator
MPSVKIVNVRLPEDLLRAYDAVVVPAERARAGYEISRNEVFVRALQEYAEKVREAAK